MFQFQYGTIGSDGAPFDCLIGEFQFQYGTIGSARRQSWEKQDYQVSIPVWYDWKS